MLVPLAFLLSRELGCSDTAALLVAAMVLLDGACLVESRLLLTDSVLLFFQRLPRTRALALALTPTLTLTRCSSSSSCSNSTRWRAISALSALHLPMCLRHISPYLAIYSPGEYLPYISPVSPQARTRAAPLNSAAWARWLFLSLSLSQSLSLSLSLPSPSPSPSP